MKTSNFSITCEADCERVAKVFVKWLQDKSPELAKKQKIISPNDIWAELFSNIYTDELINNGLENEAEDNIINVEFNIVDESFNYKDLKNQDLMDLLQDFLDTLGEHEEESFGFNDPERDDEEDE
tara:strand:- start:27492 stop:27866 length:375 start_codon:yes stop_codon:yes gene_type:complete